MKFTSNLFARPAARRWSSPIVRDGWSVRSRAPAGQGDIILLGLREFQDEKADVIMKYAADEARNLKVVRHCAFRLCFHRTSHICFTVARRPRRDCCSHSDRSTANCPIRPKSTRRTRSERRASSTRTSSSRRSRRAYCTHGPQRHQAAASALSNGRSQEIGFRWW